MLVAEAIRIVGHETRSLRRSVAEFQRHGKEIRPAGLCDLEQHVMIPFMVEIDETTPECTPVLDHILEWGPNPGTCRENDSRSFSAKRSTSATPFPERRPSPMSHCATSEVDFMVLLYSEQNNLRKERTSLRASMFQPR